MKYIVYYFPHYFIECREDDTRYLLIAQLLNSKCSHFLVRLT